MWGTRLFWREFHGRSRFVVSHPFAECAKGWGTHSLWADQGWAASLVVVSLQIGYASQILKYIVSLLRGRLRLTSVRVPWSRRNRPAGKEAFLGELASQQNPRVPKTLLRRLMFCF
jgi:hypothetical protein